MRYLLFVSHGTLASGMAQALSMLVGEREDVLQVAFQDGMGLPEFQKNIETVIQPIQPTDELIVMADLVSGSPLTTTMAAISEKLGLTNVRAIGGMSLPMAITAVEEEDSSLDDAVSAMTACAADQIRLFDTNVNDSDDGDI